MGKSKVAASYAFNKRACELRWEDDYSNEQDGENEGAEVEVICPYCVEEVVGSSMRKRQDDFRRHCRLLVTPEGCCHDRHLMRKVKKRRKQLFDMV